MAVTISGVEPRSPAARAGVRAGDILEEINGRRVEDVLDYRFYMMERRLRLHIRTPDGAAKSCDIRKGEYDDLGLRFETYLMDKQRHCKNKCIFCFIDQLPPGMRDSLYFKDDDSRMSFLFGNYITLTNLTERDIERIIQMRISPVNISVHTMNPTLRVSMMANPRAGDVLDWLPRLTDAGIAVNAQLVLCPGINDGEELRYSLRALLALAPALQSVAVVPVGLTAYRDGLARLRLFTEAEAAAVIELVDAFGGEALCKHARRICFAADEFYLAARRAIPPAPFYEDFAQLENGVGMLALLSDEFAGALADCAARSVQRSVTIATGIAAEPFIRDLAAQAMRRFSGLDVRVRAVINDFFGHTITVAGLVTGGDLVAQLHGAELGDELLIPAAMLRRERDLFLDGMTVEQAAAQLGVPVRAVSNDGADLLEAMLGISYRI